MKGIFISYRRQDAAGYAGRLYDRLVSHFGAERVFMDVEGIEPGVDFVDALERAVASCEVLIVIIGAGWLAIDKAGKRRLDDPKDFVHIETAAALARHIRVVPVLVDGAVMPRAEELPADLAPLTRRQAVELSHKYWDGTSAELIRTLERVLDGDKAAGRGEVAVASTAPPGLEEKPLLVVHTRDIRRPWVIGGVLALVAAGVGIYLTQPWEERANLVAEAERAAVAPPTGTGAAPPSAEKPALLPMESPAAPSAEKPPAPEAVKPPVPIPEKAPAPTAEKPPPAPAEKSPAPPAEKAAQLPAEKHPAPSPEKAAPRPTEKAAPSSAAKTEAPAPGRAPEKAAASKASQAAKSPPVEPPAKSAAATTAAPPARAAEAAPAPASPDEKAAGATPARPVEKAPGPVAVAPATAPPVAAAPATAPPVTAPVAPSAALPAVLPRVGDTWEYRMRSKWATVPPRTYAHLVTAVSAREVTETMSLVASPDGAAVRQAFTPDTRFVEWRGRGFYLLEFNPFLEAFGGLQNAAAISALPAMPAENPLQAGWYGRARIRGSESVTVPAGTFKSLKVEIDSNRAPTEGLGMRSSEPVRALLTLWYAPEVKRTVKMVRVVLTEEGMHLDEDTYELVRYRVQ